MRVLVVEDDLKISSFLKQSLEREGLVVDCSDNGRNGLFKALNNNYGLIILDISIPELSGQAILKEIRLRDVNIPIIMITAQHELESKISMFDNGADDYITKPFQIEEVIIRIKALLRRTTDKKDNEHFIKIDNLVIDTNRRLVHRDNNKITLSKKEYDLLIFLTQHRGKIVTRNTILEQVWQNHLDILPTTIDVHVCWLRNKIDLPHLKPLVHTERGVGYMLDDTK